MSTKKRSHGEGSWRKKNSLWEYRISFRTHDGASKNKSFYGKTKTFCLDKYKEYIKKNGDLLSDNNVTLQEYA